MACLIKLPVDGGKGIVTFTSIEYDYYISQSPILYRSLFSAKEKWVLGFHYNSPHKNTNFIPDSLFDFYIAGPGDISNSQGKSFYQIEMDCSNFCPDYFEETVGYADKYWDLLFISRNTIFKSLNDLLAIIRKIFDRRLLRVLAIIPHESCRLKSRLVDDYLRIFNESERKYFTLLTPSIDYPFPFDLKTLAFYYHHARAFLHVAQKERHPRVVAYAWASGLPVIAPKEVGSLLPQNLQKPPGFYAYRDLDHAVDCIEESLRITFDPTIKSSYSSFHLSKYSVPRFKEEITKLFSTKGIAFADNKWLLKNLDLRLASHHTGAESPNTIPMSLYKLSLYLNNPSRLDVGHDDPETCLYETENKLLETGLNEQKVNFQLKLNNAKSKALTSVIKLKSKSKRVLISIIKMALKLFFKLRFFKSPEKDILCKQIDRTFEHLALDNAVIHSKRMLSQIQREVTDKDIAILAVGCCNMIEINVFKDLGYKNVTGIDLISFSKKYIKIMDMHRMDFADNSFDLIYCSGAFHCTYDPRGLAREFVRVLKNNGYICITVVVDFPLSGAYRYDPKSLAGLHSLFGNQINKIIWSETVEPKSEFNPNANTVIRTMFSINKEV